MATLNWLDQLLFGIRKVFDAGTEMPQRPNIRVQGAGKPTVTDDPATNATVLDFASGGGGSTPTGTGLRKVVSGTEAPAAALLVNADVDASAAIEGSKLQAASASNAGAMAANDFAKLASARKRGTSALIGTQNNFDPGDSEFVEFTGGSGTTITGIVAPTGNRPTAIQIVCAPGNTIQINHQDTGSTAANRLENWGNGSPIVSTAMYWYSPARSRWVLRAYTT